MFLFLFSTLLFAWIVKGDILGVPNINDREITGKLGLIGKFAGISFTKDMLQFHSPSNILLQQNDTYLDLTSFVDGNITAACALESTIYLGGQFRVVNQTVNYIVQYNIETNQFQPLNQGLDGPVLSLYCDSTDSILYVGGLFTAPLNTNASLYGGHVAQWYNNTWLLLPWKGLNGPVYTITKNNKQNTILFGGRFNTTLFTNTSNLESDDFNTSQTIPMDSPFTTISDGNGAYSSNPESVVCPSKVSQNASSQPWTLKHGVPGYWEAQFAHPVQPTIFRLSNLPPSKGRGTVSFNILALGSNEYFNLSYFDPATHQVVSCLVDCILSNDTFQDFTVLNPITVSGIRININTWYGKGGGLSYVQIYQSDISLYPALNTGNGACQGSSSSRVIITGNWKDIYVYGYYQKVLGSKISVSRLSTTNTSITYQPNIPSYGQYNIYATTPGCIGSSNCYKRTQVEYQLRLQAGQLTTVYLDQNVFEDSRTLLYSGPVSPISENFRPAITLRPALNSTVKGEIIIMADTIDFVRNSSAAPFIISILEHNLTLAKNSSAVSWKPLNQQLPLISTVYSIDASSGDMLYIGGEFSYMNFSNPYNNIVAYEYQTGLMAPLASIGLNGKVLKIVAHNASKLFIAGEFTSTSVANINLPYVSQYDLQQKSWLPLQRGVNGPVTDLLLISNNTLMLTGFFSCQFTFAKRCIKSGGISQWDITSGSWIKMSSLLIGQVKLVHRNESQTLIIGNQLNGETYRADMAIFDSDHLAPNIFDNESQFYPTFITAGVVTQQDSIVIAGHFTNDNMTRILISNNTGWILVDELQGDVYCLAEYRNRLYVGGRFQSNRSVSFAIYDLINNNTNIPIYGIFDKNDGPGIVNSIEVHPDGKNILIGGEFLKTGSLSCSTVCMLDPVTLQWNAVVDGLTGAVRGMFTSKNSEIIIFGDIYAHQQSLYIANLKDQISPWTMKADSTFLPGIPVSVIEGVDANTFIVAGFLNNAVGFFVGIVNDKTYNSFNNTGLGPSTTINQILLVPALNASYYYPEVAQNMLLAFGDIDILNIGHVSAALYDGNIWLPYLTSTQWDSQPGQIYKMIHKSDFYDSKNLRHYLSVVAVVLISVGISTGILFLMSAIGILYVFKYHPKNNPEPMPRYERLIDAFGIAATTSLGVTPIAGLAGPSKPRRPYKHDDEGIDFGMQQDSTADNSVVDAAYLTPANEPNSPPAINEANPRIFYAKYPFKSQGNGELDLNEGDKIIVMDTSDNIWWLGSKEDGTGKIISGVFPSNYVKT
ncbi:hypothetical protein G6F64_005408 [Rhizopus arrhizus]|uniref:SH3 domain-containing protein n=1 Tax=Rhizopus oryzae TaxID=64495 RepID=A0A9P6XAM4_RHIOR|nr:hypothetical protein G6F64_005408 [Rhizopus arrhizus]